MNKLILFYPNKSNDILKTPVSEKDYTQESREDIHKTLQEHCKHYGGLGLAANQIGLDERAFIIDGKTYFNPRLMNAFGDLESSSEGCLSFLSVRHNIKRFVSISVEYSDIDGNDVTEDLEGLDAIAFQHELDHLDGFTMLDRISSNIQKKKFLEKYKKKLKKVT